jgi:Putative Actinobacterial Holin-X, holin superfamily III
VTVPQQPPQHTAPSPSDPSPRRARSRPVWLARPMGPSRPRRRRPRRPRPGVRRCPRGVVGELVGNVTRDLSTLMRQELALARAELKAEAGKTGKACPQQNRSKHRTGQFELRRPGPSSAERRRPGYRGHSTPRSAVPAGRGVIVVTVVGWEMRPATATCNALIAGPVLCAARASRESHFSIIVIVPSSTSCMA